MAKAVCCDRCDKFAKVNMHSSINWRVLDGNNPSASDPCGERAGILLCGECAADFDVFMQGVVNANSANRTACGLVSRF